MEQYELITDCSELLKRAPQLQEDIQSYEEPFLFFEEGKPTMIGEIRLSSMDIYVKNLYSLEQRKGNGRRFVDFLQQQLHHDGVIMGESVVPALSFWSKMDAVFDSIAMKRYQYATEHDEELPSDTVIPFMIHKKQRNPLL